MQRPRVCHSYLYFHKLERDSILSFIDLMYFMFPFNSAEVNNYPTQQTSVGICIKINNKLHIQHQNLLARHTKLAHRHKMLSSFLICY